MWITVQTFCYIVYDCNDKLQHWACRLFPAQDTKQEFSTKRTPQQIKQLFKGQYWPTGFSCDVAQLHTCFVSRDASLLHYFRDLFETPPSFSYGASKSSKHTKRERLSSCLWYATVWEAEEGLLYFI